MSTSIAEHAGITPQRSRDSVRSEENRRRRAARAERRHRSEQRRHDREVHDDRYLDRSGIALSPIVLGVIWQR